VVALRFIRWLVVIEPKVLIACRVREFDGMASQEPPSPLFSALLAPMGADPRVSREIVNVRR